MSTDYDYPSLLFPPPNMFTAPPPTPNSFTSPTLFPPPNMFTAPPPTPNSFTSPTQTSDKFSGILIWIVVVIVLCALGFLLTCLSRCFNKPREDSPGEENIKKNNAFDVDLECGLPKKRRSDSKVSGKRQSKGSVHPLKKSVENINACRGNMVHGYDKRLSSSKVNAKYYNNADAKNYSTHGGNRKFEFDDRFSSSRHKLLHNEKSKELPLSKDTNKTNYWFPDSESDESSSS